MRILYLTAYLSDVDVAQRALEKGAHGPVRIEPCTGVRDVTRGLAGAPVDGVVVDVTSPTADLVSTIRELREVAPHTPIIALVRSGAAGVSADALVAGADDTLAKHREFYLLLPAIIAQANARRQATGRWDARQLRTAADENPAAAMPPMATPRDNGAAPPAAGEAAAVSQPGFQARPAAPGPDEDRPTAPSTGRDDVPERVGPGRDDLHEQMVPGRDDAHDQRIPTPLGRDDARDRLREAEAFGARLQSRLAEREEELARLHVILATIESEHRDSEASHVARLAELSDARQQRDRHEEDAAAQIALLQALLEDAAMGRQRLEREVDALNASVATLVAERDTDRTTHEAVAAELASLRAASEAHHRDQVALADVRLQMARLQTDAAAIEFQQRALSEANDRTRRLQQALEDALATHADLQHQLREKEASVALLNDELEQARTALGEQSGSGDRVAHLEAQLEALEAERSQIRLDNETLHEQHAVLERALESAKADLEGALEASRAADHELARLQQDRNDATLELARQRELHAETLQLRVAAEAVGASLASRLAGIEEDLATARSSLAAMADERNALKQAFADVSGARTHDVETVAALHARVEQLEAALAEARAQAEAIGQDASAVRSALEYARRDMTALQDRIASTDAERRGLLDEEQRLREQVAQATFQVADHRRRLAEVEAEREYLRGALERADAGAQLLAGRHLDDRDAVRQSLDELRTASAQAEARWAAQRAEFEHALAARAEQHRRVSESGVVGLATTAPEGQLLRCNDTLARFCGYPGADDLLRHPDGIVLPLPVDWPGFARYLSASSGPVVVESCVQHPDGRIAWLQAGATLVVLDGQASAIEWTVVDATDRYLRMRQLRQSRRLDAIRELTVSAGREIVEQLAATGRADGADEPSARQHLQRSVARARDVAQQLVAFAQKQARMPQLLDLSESFVNLQPTLRRLAGDDVTIETALTPGALVVSTDPTETEQWITSLVVACRDALPSGGSLTLSTRALDLASAGTGGERRITPAAQVSFLASGLGALPVAVSASLSDLLAHRGGTVRPSHDVITNTTRVDVYLPLVRPTRAADAPFPLVRRQSIALTPESA